MCRCPRKPKALGPPGAGFTGISELPNVGTETQTLNSSPLEGQCSLFFCFACLLFCFVFHTGFLG